MTSAQSDTMREFRVAGDQDPPKEFSSRKGATMIIWKRVKK
ncbi:MAG TPA: hypothetical protein VGZ47_07400 [Gemmataceae bacterium]|nr:hypothetical protein [Gemmataceae bacterium]